MSHSQLQQNSFDRNSQNLDWHGTKVDVFNTDKKHLHGKAQVARHIGYVSPYRAAYFRAAGKATEQNL